MLVIELTETHGHLAAARTRSCHDYQGLLSLDIVIPAKAIVRGDKSNIGRISVNYVVNIALYAHAFQSLTKRIGTGLSVVVCDDD